MNTNKLLPIGARVAHFGNLDAGHKSGVIVSYNKQPINRYAEEKLSSAIELAEKARLLQSVTKGLYTSSAFPYIVRWDCNPCFFERHKELRSRFPDERYVDVYEIDSLQPFSPWPDRSSAAAPF